MLLCIQTDSKLGDDDFDTKLRLTEGYKYLTNKKQKASLSDDTPYVLWDNKDPYPEQLKNFTDRLNTIPEFTKDEMSTAFEFIERKLEPFDSQPEPQPAKGRRCKIL